MIHTIIHSYSNLNTCSFTFVFSFNCLVSQIASNLFEFLFVSCNESHFTKWAIMGFLRNSQMCAHKHLFAHFQLSDFTNLLEHLMFDLVCQLMFDLLSQLMFVWYVCSKLWTSSSLLCPKKKKEFSFLFSPCKP